MNNEAIVNSIKNLCKDRNISASQLEKEIGLSQGLISKWQKTIPSLDKIVDIADYFHVSLDLIVGRDSNFKDKFLEMIYNKTLNNTLIWQPNFQKNSNKILLPHKDYYDEDTYIEIAYYSDFNDGNFIINCLCKYHQTIDPLELDFYIKPDEKSSLVFQEYSVDELKPLWLAIINNLTEGTPDEIKAENLKQQFLSSDFLVVDKNKNEMVVEVRRKTNNK